MTKGVQARVFENTTGEKMNRAKCISVRMETVGIDERRDTKFEKMTKEDEGEESSV